MQQLQIVLTGLIFAVHALLGCGLHHVCESDHAVAHHAAHPSHHHHPAGQSGHPAHSEGHDDSSPVQCQQVACSFVKSEPLRLDLGSQLACVADVAYPALAAQPAPSRLAENDSRCQAHLSAAPLFVLHCALLI